MIFYIFSIMPGGRHMFFKVNAPSKEHISKHRFWDDARKDLYALSEDEMTHVRKESNLALARGEVIAIEFGSMPEQPEGNGAFVVRNVGSHEDFPNYEAVKLHVDRTTPLQKCVYLNIVAPFKDMHDRVFDVTDRTKLH